MVVEMRPVTVAYWHLTRWIGIRWLDETSHPVSDMHGGVENPNTCPSTMAAAPERQPVRCFAVSLIGRMFWQ